MEKLLLLCKRARPDILTGVVFLTTRARETYEDEDNKLSRILKYISGTRDLLLTMKPDSTKTVKWWVDVAFLVHHNMKSHTGGMTSMRRGALYSAPSKQKTEHEELNRSRAGRSG